MDIVLILPLAALFFCQVLLSLLLLAPRSVSKHVASSLSFTKSSSVFKTVLHTTAVIISAVTLTSVIQVLGVSRSMSAPQYGDRMLALNIEELRALLTVVLGVANLVLLFVNPALAAEQQTADKAALNLTVLRKQAMGQQSYLTTTHDSSKGGAGGGGSDASGSSSRAEISKLIAEKQKLLEAIDDAKADAAAAAKNLAAVKAQAQGLEREYDRLLSESDGLKRRLARYDGQYSASDKKSA